MKTIRKKSLKLEVTLVVQMENQNRVTVQKNGAKQKMKPLRQKMEMERKLKLNEMLS